MAEQSIFAGDWFESNNCGRCQVINYNHSKDITVKFERSGVEKSFSGSQLRAGTISDKIFREVKIGDKFETTSSGLATVIELLPKSRVIVQFENGNLKECTKSLLVVGSVYNGSWNYTKDEVIKLMSEKHKNKYSYNIPEFKTVKDKFVANCSKHGNFETNFDNHYNGGKGCSACGDERTAKKKTMSKDRVFSDIFKAHGDLYDYSKSIYKNTETKIEIICKTHGSFWQAPEKHKLGQHCPECADTTPMNTKKFLERLPSKHEGVYSYEMISEDHFLVNGKVLPILCKLHGLFYQHYRNHLNGSGCPECTTYGFNKRKSGTFYILNEGNTVKVGITNRDVNVRLKEINKTGKSFVIHSTLYFDNGEHCSTLETELLKFMRSLYKNTEGCFDGVTESFDHVNLEYVLNEIENIRSRNGI